MSAAAGRSPSMGRGSCRPPCGRRRCGSSTRSRRRRGSSAGSRRGGCSPTRSRRRDGSRRCATGNWCGRGGASALGRPVEQLPRRAACFDRRWAGAAARPVAGAPQPISCKAVAGPQRHNFPPELVPVRPLRQGPVLAPALPPVLAPVRPPQRDPALAPATGARAQNMSNNRAGRVENRQELQGNRQQRRDEVRNQVAANHPRLDFWSDHPGWAARRIT